MGERLSRDEKKARTRRQLLDAAAEVFAELGFVAATLDLVAERAGLTKGAVYSNFRSKEDLLLALMEDHLYERVERIATAAHPDQPMGVQAAEAGRLFMSVFDASRDWFLLGFEVDVHVARNPEFRERFFARYRELRERCATLVQAGADAAGLPLPMPAEHLALALFALGNGVALERLNNPDVPPELFGDVLALLYDGMAHRAERG